MYKYKYFYILLWKDLKANASLGFYAKEGDS